MLGTTYLSDSVQDNGFSTQSPSFDYLLDLDGRPIHPSEGELYVPIGYMKDGTTKIGDIAIIANQQFTVAGFLRDGQMNSSLSSSKHFLVHENDYRKLESEGTLEYLIEFQLHDLATINAFETAYSEAGLEANGPTITYTLFKVINGLSDGIMIAIILLVGMLIVLITFMCVRFTLLTKIEEDYLEIATMKAIGLRLGHIKNIYVAKYAVLAIIGSVLGLFLSFIFSTPLLENIRLYMGRGEHQNLSVLLAIVGSFVVFLFVISYVYFLLRRFNKVSTASAIRTGAPIEQVARQHYFLLHKNTWLPVNLFLGIKDVLTRKKLYVTMLVVLILSSFIMIVPWNTYATISSSSFTKYLGFGEMDLMVSVYPSHQSLENNHGIAEHLSMDNSLKQFMEITAKTFYVKNNDGSEEKITIELGNHSTFPIEYSSGRAPEQYDEIALSSMNAQAFEKQVGDTIHIITDSGLTTFTITGIYANILNGGKTAKATFPDNTAQMMWISYYIQLNDPTHIATKAEELSQAFTFAKVADVQQYKEQVFGTMVTAIKTASIIALVVSLLITGLISLLFMKLLIAKDRSIIALLKAIGFQHRDLSKQYATRGIFILIIGVISGTLLANTIGESIAGMMVSSFGIDTFHFTSHPLIYLGCPLLMLLVTLFTTRLGTNQAGKISIVESLKE